MAGGFPIGFDVCNGQSVGFSSATSSGTALTAGAANTKGSWTQLIASTSFDAVFVSIALQYYNSGNSNIAVDIGVGGAGLENVIVSNLLLGNDQTVSANASAGAVFSFPLQILAGTRVSARCQSTAGSDNNNAVSLILFDGAFTQIEGCAGVDSIGFNAAATDGTTITGSGSTNTKGSYAQIIASTSRDYSGIFAAFDTLNNGALTNPNFAVDVAVGGSGSEQIIVPNFCFWTNGGAGIYDSMTPFYPISIPSGTRLSARHACTQASKNIGITLYGVYQ